MLTAPPLELQKIRKDFPVLGTQMNGKPLVYLDNAATSQKPSSVIKAMNDFYHDRYATINRGVYTLSQQATEACDQVRLKCQKFLNAAKHSEIIFTKGTTESINMVMYGLMDSFKEGDEIILTVMEHHSNLVPWQQLQKKGVRLKFVDIDEEGKLKMEELRKLMHEKTRLIAFTFISNVLGTVNPAAEICALAREKGILSLVDAAQAVPHRAVDVRKLGCDFLVFSGHKMLGPQGIGILYGRKEILGNLTPLLYGGDMVKEVSLEQANFAEVPQIFEAGTQNVVGAVGLGRAVDYLLEMGMEAIEEHDRDIVEYALEKLLAVDGLVLYGPRDARFRGALVSFNLGNIHPHDVAEFLGSKGIIVRAGHLCCQPLMKRLGISSCVRASFYIYTIREDIDKLCSALEECRRFFTHG